MTTWIILIAAYLIGSLSSAIIVCKLAGLDDPRKQGSLNPGATNVLRMGNKRLAVIVLIGDLSKGIIAVCLAKLFLNTSFQIGLAATAVVLGHIFPVFFRFKGGKGVATAAGAILALSWMLGFVVLLAWLATAYFTAYSSLGAIVAAVIAPPLSLFLAPGYFLPLMLISIIIIMKHHANIQRLIQGTESKISLK